MNIIIEIANTRVALCKATEIREQVFGGKQSFGLPQLHTYDSSKFLTLIATDVSTNTPFATLSVVDTSDESELHRSVGLKFPKNTRVARYVQLAVLKQYRGQHVPTRLIREAQLRFVAPRQVHYSWLLFPAEKAQSSFLCTDMGFIAGSGTVNTEYGLVRLLMRNEIALTSPARALNHIIPNFIPLTMGGYPQHVATAAF